MAINMQKMQTLYGNLRKMDDGFTRTFPEFVQDMQDEEKRKRLWGNLGKIDSGFTRSYDEFSNDMGLEIGGKSTEIDMPKPAVEEASVVPVAEQKADTSVPSANQSSWQNGIAPFLRSEYGVSQQTQVQAQPQQRSVAPQIQAQSSGFEIKPDELLQGMIENGKTGVGKSGEIVSRPDDFDGSGKAGVDGEDFDWLYSSFHDISDAELDKQIALLNGGIVDKKARELYKKRYGKDAPTKERIQSLIDKKFKSSEEALELSRWNDISLDASRIYSYSDVNKPMIERRNRLIQEKVWRQNNVRDENGLTYRDYLGQGLADLESRLNANEKQGGIDMNGAHHMVDEAKKLFDAPSKYGNGSGLKNWWQGTKDTFTDYDLYTLGITELSRYGNLNSIVTKLENNEGLTQEEELALESYMMLAEVQQSRANDLSMGYEIGQGSAESLSFMAQMFLTAGAGKIAQQAIVKIAEKAGARAVARGLAEGFAKTTVGNVAEKFGRQVGKDVLQTAAMGSTYSTIQQDKLKERLFGDGEYEFTDLLRSFGGALIETGTESWGGRLIDKAVGFAIPVNKIWGGKSKFGQFVSKYVQSPVGETGEEYLAGGLNWLRSFNPMYDDETENSVSNNANLRGELGEMLTGEGFARTFLTVLPMSVVGGAASAGVNKAQANYTFKHYGEYRNTILETLKKSGASEQEANDIMAQLEMSVDDASFIDKVNMLYQSLLNKHLLDNPKESKESAEKYKNQLNKDFGKFVKHAARYNDMIEKLIEQYNVLSEEDRAKVDKAMQDYADNHVITEEALRKPKEGDKLGLYNSQGRLIEFRFDGQQWLAETKEGVEEAFNTLTLQLNINIGKLSKNKPSSSAEADDTEQETGGESSSNSGQPKIEQEQPTPEQPKAKPEVKQEPRKPVKVEERTVTVDVDGVGVNVKIRGTAVFEEDGSIDFENKENRRFYITNELNEPFMGSFGEKVKEGLNAVLREEKSAPMAVDTEQQSGAPQIVSEEQQETGEPTIEPEQPVAPAVEEEQQTEEPQTPVEVKPYPVDENNKPAWEQITDPALAVMAANDEQLDVAAFVAEAIDNLNKEIKRIRSKEGMGIAQKAAAVMEVNKQIALWQQQLPQQETPVEEKEEENLEDIEKNNNFVEKEKNGSGDEEQNTGDEGGPVDGVPKVWGNGGGPNQESGNADGEGPTQDGTGQGERTVQPSGVGLLLDDVIISKQSDKNDEITALLGKYKVAATEHRVFQITGAAFRKLIEAEKKKNPHGWSVSVHPLDSADGEVGYNECKCFVTADGKSGIAVTPDGDIISLFSSVSGEKRMEKLIAWAIANGGRKADCFANGLHNMYARYGGVVVSQTPFNEEFAPDGWDGESRGPVVTVIFPESADEALRIYADYKARGVKYPSVDLEKVPEFRDDEEGYGYDKAMAYRDKVLSGEIVPENEATIDSESADDVETDDSTIDLLDSGVAILIRRDRHPNTYIKIARVVDEDGKTVYREIGTDEVLSTENGYWTVMDKEPTADDNGIKINVNSLNERRKAEGKSLIGDIKRRFIPSNMTRAEIEEINRTSNIAKMSLQEYAKESQSSLKDDATKYRSVDEVMNAPLFKRSWTGVRLTLRDILNTAMRLGKKGNGKSDVVLNQWEIISIQLRGLVDEAARRNGWSEATRREQESTLFKDFKFAIKQAMIGWNAVVKRYNLDAWFEREIDRYTVSENEQYRESGTTVNKREVVLRAIDEIDSELIQRYLTLRKILYGIDKDEPITLSVNENQLKTEGGGRDDSANTIQYLQIVAQIALELQDVIYDAASRAKRKGDFKAKDYPVFMDADNGGYAIPWYVTGKSLRSERDIESRKQAALDKITNAETIMEFASVVQHKPTALLKDDKFDKAWNDAVSKKASELGISITDLQTEAEQIKRELKEENKNVDEKESLEEEENKEETAEKPAEPESDDYVTYNKWETKDLRDELDYLEIALEEESGEQAKATERKIETIRTILTQRGESEQVEDDYEIKSSESAKASRESVEASTSESWRNRLGGRRVASALKRAGIDVEMFDNADLQKFMSDEAYQRLQDTGGTVYGFARNGKIYLNRGFMNVNTPVHEFTHLWVEAYSKQFANEWAYIVKLLKKDKTWQDVMSDPNYVKIRGNEQSVASEVMSRLMGEYWSQSNSFGSRFEQDFDTKSLGAKLRSALRKIAKWIVSAVTGGNVDLSKYNGRDFEPLMRQIMQRPLNDLLSWGEAVQEMQSPEERDHFEAMVTYHGTKANFDKFDFSFMGTGEGAQAYGWGMYVSSVKNVAISYAKQGQLNEKVLFDGKPINGYFEDFIKDKEYELSRGAINRISAAIYDAAHSSVGKENTTESLRNHLRLIADYYKATAISKVEYAEQHQEAADLIEAADWIDENINSLSLPPKRKRHLYEVEIPDDTGNNYLDWNHEVPEKEIERINAEGQKLGIYITTGWSYLGRDIYRDIEESFKRLQNEKRGKLIRFDGKEVWDDKDVFIALVDEFASSLPEVNLRGRGRDVQAQSVIHRIFEQVVSFGKSIENALEDTHDEYLALVRENDNTGKSELYNYICRWLENNYERFSLDEPKKEHPDKQTSQFLNSIGYTGVKMPVGFAHSGGMDNEKKNYVIFNENDMKVLDNTEFMIGFSNSEDEFRSRQQETEKQKGIVADNLNVAEVEIVNVPRHDFTGTGKQAIEQARQWAIKNLVGEHTAHKGTAQEYTYTIDEEAIGKYLTEITTKTSDNLGVHLAALKKLPEIIEHSIDAEVHASYAKKNNKRSIDNGIDTKDALIHRLYGAANIDNSLYRVKTTLKETSDLNKSPYAYQVTKVELLISGSTLSDALSNSTSISAAKLLKNVEKSYDKGKKLLDESKNVALSESSEHSDSNEYMIVTPRTDRALNDEEVKIKEAAIKDGSFMLAPDGSGTLLDEKQWCQTRTKNFLRWAGDWINDPEHCKVLLGDNGEPKVLYRGSANANSFIFHSRYETGALWATDDKVTAEHYARAAERKLGRKLTQEEIDERVQPIFVRMSDIAEYDAKGRHWNQASEEPVYTLMDDDGVPYWYRTREEAEAKCDELGLDYEEITESTESGEVANMEFSEGKDGVIFHNMYDGGKDAATVYVFKQGNAKSSILNNGDFDETNNDIRYMIGGGSVPAQPAERMSRFQRWVNRTLDQSNGIRLLLKKIGAIEGRKLSATEDVRDTLEAKRSKVANRLTEFYNHEGKELDKALKGLNKALHKNTNLWHKGMTDYYENESGVRAEREVSELGLIEMYLMAKDSLERLSQGKPIRGRELAFRLLQHTGMAIDTEIDTAEQQTAVFERWCEKFEKAMPKKAIDELWRAVNSCTRFTLDALYEGDLIGKEVYDELLTSKYYVPERGFAQLESDEDVNHEVTYGRTGKKSISPDAMKRAEGGESMATDVIANILSLANNAVQCAEENKVRQSAFNLLKNHPAACAELGFPAAEQVWYVRDGFNEDGSPRYEAQVEKPSQDIIDQNDAVLETIKGLREDLELFKGNAAMEDYIKQQIEETKKDLLIVPRRDAGGARLDRAALAGQQQPKVVVSMRTEDGDVAQYTMVFPNNPEIANALNGVLTKKFTDSWLGTVGHFFSAMFTTYNPLFWSRNLPKDALFAIQKGTAERGLGYGAYFAAEMLRPATTILPILRWVSNVDMQSSGATMSAIDEEFLKFMHGGGNTGFTQLKGIEEFRKEAEELLKGENAAKATLGFIFKHVPSALNEFSELWTRFSVYRATKASLATENRMIAKFGRSLIDPKRMTEYSEEEIEAMALHDARNFTTNFNRRGAGGFVDFFNSISMFANAGIQGAMGTWRTFEQGEWQKGIRGVASLMFGPAFLGFILTMLTPDDDDKEMQIPDYIRQNNLVFLDKRVPLSYELIPWYRIGVNYALMQQNRITKSDAIENIAMGFAEHSLPMPPVVNNTMSSFIDYKIGESDFSAKNPSIFSLATGLMQAQFMRSFIELEHGKSWTGANLRYNYAGDMPQFMFQDYEAELYKDLSKAIYALNGGSLKEGELSITVDGRKLNDTENISPKELKSLIGSITPNGWEKIACCAYGLSKELVLGEGDFVREKDKPFSSSFKVEQNSELFRIGVSREMGAMIKEAKENYKRIEGLREMDEKDAAKCIKNWENLYKHYTSLRAEKGGIKKGELRAHRMYLERTYKVKIDSNEIDDVMHAYTMFMLQEETEMKGLDRTINDIELWSARYKVR